jgi:hypothetical protein
MILHMRASNFLKHTKREKKTINKCPKYHKCDSQKDNYQVSSKKIIQYLADFKHDSVMLGTRILVYQLDWLLFRVKPGNQMT